jgi:1-acyl-sn-glycerol-3-phosphate acyltransferase
MSPSSPPAIASGVPPFKPKMRPNYAAMQALFNLTAWLWLRFEVVHPERIPPAGPFLILPTHTSMLDPPLVGAGISRECRFLARESLLRVPLLGGYLGWQCNTHGIQRGGGDRQALTLCREILSEGWPLVYFPEGTRSSDGKLGKIHRGFVRILESSPQTPYLPVVMQDTHGALGRGQIFPRPHKVRFVIGEPTTLMPREFNENPRHHQDRCVADLERRYRELGAR